MGRRKKRKKNSPFIEFQCQLRRVKTIIECLKCGKVITYDGHIQYKYQLNNMICTTCRARKKEKDLRIIGHQIEYEELDDDDIIRMIANALAK